MCATTCTSTRSVSSATTPVTASTAFIPKNVPTTTWVRTDRQPLATKESRARRAACRDLLRRRLGERTGAGDYRSVEVSGRVGVEVGGVGLVDVGVGFDEGGEKDHTAKVDLPGEWRGAPLPRWTATIIRPRTRRRHAHPRRPPPRTNDRRGSGGDGTFITTPACPG